MLVCSVVLRPKRATIAAAIAEVTEAFDSLSPGAVFAILADDPGAASDHLDGFVGQLMGEAASAAAVVNAGSIRNAIIVDQTNATATTYWPGTYALAITETATATATQSSAIAVGPIVATVTETAAAGETLYTNVALTSGLAAVLDGTFVDPAAPSSLLGTDALDSGPISIFATGFEGGGPGAPSTGIPIGPVSGGPGTWTVPADWNNASNSIECIGGGAGGLGAGVIWALGGYGGGGGAYSKLINVTLTPGAIINFHIGEGGAWNADGGDTWWNTSSTLLAQGGRGQTGGQASAGIGAVKYNGGNGGGPGGYGAGGGGGAGGPNGAGCIGGDGLGVAAANGGGGGAGSGGAAGNPPASSAAGGPAGAGGNSYLGAGGGVGGSITGGAATTSGGAGANGGGGGGGAGYSPDGTIYWVGHGGKGGNGREWGKNIGAGGGGGGGGSSSNGGKGGYYGGGGGGVSSAAGPASQGGAGASGIIIIRYDP